MNRLPIFIVGAWKDDGTFYTPFEWCVTNSQHTATEILRKAIREKQSWLHDLHYNVYKFTSDKFNDIVIDNSELEFYEEVQRILEPLQLRSSINYDNLIDVKKNKRVDTYTSLSYTFDVKTKTIILTVNVQLYQNYITKECGDMIEATKKEIYNSLQCVEIPKMKQILRELNSDIRVSIVDQSKRKVFPGFITK